MGKGLSMADNLEIALKQNFHYFQSVVSSLMERDAGKYALVHSQSVVAVFARPMEALDAGYERFTDGLFSIQKVTDRPLDLGFMSYGSGERSTD